MRPSQGVRLRPVPRGPTQNATRGVPPSCVLQWHLWVTGRCVKKIGVAPPVHTGRHMDAIFVAATIVFFALSLAYVRGCDRL